MCATRMYFCLFYSFFELYNLYSIIELGTRWRSRFPILHVGGHVKTAWVYMLPFSGMNEIRYSGIVKWEKVSSIFIQTTLSFVGLMIFYPLRRIHSNIVAEFDHIVWSNQIFDLVKSFFVTVILLFS